MRDFTLVQDIGASVDEHWRTFFDPAFERAIVAAMKFRHYEIVAHDDTATAIHRKTRAVPRLDAAATVARFFGSSFGYVEDGSFDKQAQIWRARTIPDTFSDRMHCDMVMELAPAETASTSRRTLRFHIEARVRGIGGMVESAFEKNLRTGWRDSAAFINDWLRRPPS